MNLIIWLQKAVFDNQDQAFALSLARGLALLRATSVVSADLNQSVVELEGLEACRKG